MLKIYFIFAFQFLLKEVILIIKISLYPCMQLFCMTKLLQNAKTKYFLAQGYLDQEGKPVGYAGLVSHLHYREPSNFVLVDFLTKGLLHKLCQPIQKGKLLFNNGKVL